MDETLKNENDKPSGSTRRKFLTQVAATSAAAGAAAALPALAQEQGIPGRH